MTKSKRQSTEFQISKYAILFSGLFTCKEFGDLFFEYLKIERNEAPWLFLMDTRELKETKSVEQARSMCFKIYEKYLEKNADLEINISGSNKLKMKSKLDTIDKEDSLEELHDFFQSIEAIVTSELHADSFPRFIRSSMCAKFCQRNVNNKEVLQLKTALEFPYVDSDFDHPVITAKDFAFIRQMNSEDLGWELVGSSKKEYNAYYYPSNALLTKTQLFNDSVVEKITAVFPYSFDHVVSCLVPFSNYPKYDPTYVGSCTLPHPDTKQIETVIEKPKGFYHDLPVICSAIEFQFQFPLSTRRRQVQAVSISYDPSKEELIVIGKPCKVPNLNIEYGKKVKDMNILNPGDKRYSVYYMLGFGGRVFKKFDENRTLYTEIFIIDIFGWASNSESFKRSIVKQRGKTLLSTMSGVLEEPKEQLTLESLKPELMKDDVGRMLAKINIPEIRKKYAEQNPERRKSVKSQV